MCITMFSTLFFFFSSRRRHTRYWRDWSSDVCSSDLADIISPEEARRMEPSVNPSLIGAVKVPDASIDPFRLTMANIIDARRHGADILTYHEVTGFIMESGRVVGVKLRDNRGGATSEARGRVTINAAGIWGHLLARMADISVNMFPAKIGRAHV